MNKDINILLIDDNDTFREALYLLLSNAGYHADSAANADAGLKLAGKGNYHIVFVDYKLPDMNGIELIGKLKHENPAPDFVLMTGYASLEIAVEAGRIGAYDFIEKPFQPDKILHLIKEILSNNKSLQETGRTALNFDFDGNTVSIIGKSPGMQKVFDLVEQIAPTESTVLILGESGTGKELIARAIHAKSKRAQKPFLAIDCGSLVESLFESELFGHVKGSFTGAHATKHGALELANKGTFFFDEIGNISLNMQVKILRAIQEKEIRRVGETSPIKVDVRVVAATNSDLKQAVANGHFREDLYYRISVIPIKLPPLRERREDIPDLVDHFIRKHNYKKGREIHSVSDKALKALTEYYWPGNIRELENVIERAIIVEGSSTIGLNSLPAFIKTLGAEGGREIYSLADMEKSHINKILKITNRNISKAAKLLEIDRKTLYKKISRYGL
ncbi:sigma-54-dependent Fis family transcriptional regulator [candidate division KSB1 bacterium]|nr:sigma-54-dependent Fis family transcriptional regulator [candidate division KSB1 bacterium]